MKRLLLSAAGLAMLAGIALAQDAGTPPPAPPAGQDQPAAAPDAMAPDAMAPDDMDMDDMDFDDAGGPPPAGPRHGPGKMGERGPGWRHGPRGHRPPPPPPEKAAHYRIERGDLRIDVKCAEDEPAKACADTVMTILDKALAAPSPK